MRINDAAGVGLTVIVAAAVLAGGTLLLRRFPLGGESYRQKVLFPNAQGIQQGAPVRVQGVELGHVQEIRLGADGRPVLTFRMEDRRQYQLQPSDGIRIVGGLFGFSPPYVEITPNARARPAAITTPSGETLLLGEVSAGSDQLLARTGDLLENLNSLTTRLNRVTGNIARMMEDPKLRTSFTRTASNFEKVSTSGVVIARNMEIATGRASNLIARFESTASGLDRTLNQTNALIADFRSTAGGTRELIQETRATVRETRATVRETRSLVQNTGEVIQGTGGLVSDTRATLGENRERLKELFTNLNGSLKQFDSTLVEARSFLGDQEARANLRATTENVRDATANLERITEDVRGLTGDPKVQEDLRATLTGLREATQEAAATFRRVRGVLGGGEKTGRSVSRRLRETEVTADLTRTARSARTRLDLNATIPWSDSSFYRLGFYDFGENNRLNIQAGQELRSGLWGRFGIYASKLGVGLDIGRGQRPPFSLDIFGVDRPHVDLRGNIPVGRSVDLTIGFENALRRPDPIIGLRYRR